MKRSAISLAAFFFAAACVPLHAGAQGPSSATVIPLHRVGNSRLRSVTVRIAGQPAEFLFDTGNGTTIIDSSLAVAVGCVPHGSVTGFRMTGERLSGPRCDSVALGVGPISESAQAGVADMAKLLGGAGTKLRGAVSLQAFAGRAITLDLAHDQLLLESAASLAARAATMREIPARIATGQSGAELDVFLAMPSAEGPLWLEWDSGHQAPTFLAPHAARALGMPDSVKRDDIRIPVAGELVDAPAQVRDIIYDGVLSEAFIERATWTVDLAHSRAWVSRFAPIPALPRERAGDVTPPATNPVGVYELQATVGKSTQHGVLRIWREGDALKGQVRGMGDEDVLNLSHVRMDGAVLSYDMPLGVPTPVVITFDGLTGAGRWGTTERGGANSAVKRS